MNPTRFIRSKLALAGMVIVGVPGVLAVMLKTAEHTVPVLLLIGLPIVIGRFAYKRLRRW